MSLVGPLVHIAETLEPQLEQAAALLVRAVLKSEDPRRMALALAAEAAHRVRLEAEIDAMLRAEVKHGG
jgi:hypothetical protein